MNTKRPINLNPLAVKIPIMAFVSISHRLSGILVFLLIPLLLSLLGQSLASPEGLAQAKETLASPIYFVMLWLLIAGGVFHLLAGIRHILMDLHFGDSLCWARLTAKWVIVGTIILLIAAFWAWGVA